MALRMPGKQIEQIDLTLDSDEDDRPKTYLRPPASKSPSKNTPITPPGSSQPQSSTVSNPQAVAPLPAPQVHSRLSSAPNPKPATSHKSDQAVLTTPKDAHGQLNAQSYTPVYTTLRFGKSHDHGNAQADKRRKLSAATAEDLTTPQRGKKSSPRTHEPPIIDLTNAPEEGQVRGNAQKVSAQKDASSVKLASNGLPSVQSLNSALKANRTKAKSPYPAIDSRSAQPEPKRQRLIGSSPRNVGLKTSNGCLGDGYSKNMAHLQTPQAEEVIMEQEDSRLTPNLAFRSSPSKNSSVFPAANELSHNGAPTKTSATTPLHPTLSCGLSLPEEDHDSVISSSDDSMVGNVPAPHTSKSISSPHVSARVEGTSGKIHAPLSNSRNGSRMGSWSPNNNLSASDVTRSDQVVAGRKRGIGAFSEQESHLLIFLKEVKQLSWKEITRQFQVFYPTRQYHNLQSHYSTKLNKRDRSKDPPTLNLPLPLASDATVDWATVHASITTPRVDREIIALQRCEMAQDESSGTESAPRRNRPKRAVAPKNYAWPKLNDHTQDIEGAMDVDSIQYVDTIEVEMQSVSEESAEEAQTTPGKAIPVDNDPLDIDIEKEDALVMLAHDKKPYLSHSERSLARTPSDEFHWDQLSSRNWQGAILHIDFNRREADLVEQVIRRLIGTTKIPESRSTRKRLQVALRCLPEPKLLQLTMKAAHRLSDRDQRSVRAFIEDCISGKAQIGSPCIKRMAAARPDRSRQTDNTASTVSMLRQRELGLQSRRGWGVSSQALTYQIKNKLQDSMGPVLSYTGASHDVHAVAWSSDSQYFAAGAICFDDPDSMQYNRPNNLLYGDVSGKALYELGEHNVNRPKTEKGPNSTHAMYASQDPKLYKTVSAVAFSPNGRFMFSGGYDNHVCVWDITAGSAQPELIVAMKHKAEIDMLAVNRSGLLATASKKGDNHAIKVITIPENEPNDFRKRNLGSRKAAEKPDYKILPTALQFSPRYENLLLAGFGANARDDGRDTNGDICLWDVNGAASSDQLYVYGSGKNVFDLAFHHRHPWFAVGCVAGSGVNRGTKSVIRLYDENGAGSNNTMRYGTRIELECKAKDMNDVVWCPGDDYLVAAGCTNGRAYVWDIRRPDHLLRELAHGYSTMPLDDHLDREITDTGIRFLSWGDNATRLYTGSSDGVVKVWNVVRSEEETFVKDLITTDSGIMSGAFSPDRSRLILGEVNGSVTVLEVGHDDCDLKDAENFKFCPYRELPEEVEHSLDAHVPDSGFASAAELLQNEQMVTVPMGGLPVRQAVQGPNYTGPFDYSMEAPALREQALQFQYELARNPGPQCTIPACTESVTKITDEERGDSGRSADRIPNELRKQFLALGSNAAAIPGKSRCTNCGRAARPSDSPSASVLCERCSFACFRCGAASALQPGAETFSCPTCDRVWEIGVLGYECVKESHSRIDMSGVPSLKRYDRELFEERMAAAERGTGDSFGDDMNALTDYYFGLAIDRPESPPL